jgi:chemotaxis signal transduction protein
VNDTYIVFEVAGTTYAVASPAILHMEMVEAITPVPNAAQFVDGVVLSRGQVVPVVNLRARFGFERAPLGLRTRLLVVKVGGRTVGLLVDSAREFVRLADTDIRPPHEAMASATGPYIAGVTTRDDRIILVLDVARLLEQPEAAITA